MRVRSVIVLTTFAVLAAACAGARTTATAPNGSPVPEVLDFEAPLLAGGTFRGADLVGKDVAFWFWAPW